MPNTGLSGQRVVDARILEIRGVGQSIGPDDVFSMRIQADLGEWAPGQFVMVRPPGFGLETPWARPFSICDGDASEIRLLVQAVGRGTRELSRLQAGARITVWGPLGRSFQVEDEAVLLAGGVGVAPFFGYVKRHPTPSGLRMLFAHRPPGERYLIDELEGLIPVERVEERAPSDIPAIAERVRRAVAEAGVRLVLACGPTPFLKTVQSAALACKARAQLSLENRMACGVGACLGCVVRKVSGPPTRTCVEGPVFWADEVDLEES
ncbi:MAG: dihydroorotate dehydrogenase electron transfer subunit [Desulfovibrionales bacterium]|nr:dihydroorotate dehydrogenase electron transfer subunit [Desulfovibrionales bacterium]